MMADMEILKRVLVSRGDFVRFAQATFAALVLFDVLRVSTDQFAGVVLSVEALFQLVSKLAFERDLADLEDLLSE